MGKLYFSLHEIVITRTSVLNTYFLQENTHIKISGVIIDCDTYMVGNKYRTMAS